VADTFKRLNKSMHGDDNAFYRLPENQSTAAQYLLLYEMSLPYGLDLNDQINLDKSASKVLAAFGSMSVTDVLALDREIKQWLATNMPNTRYISAGVQIMFAELMSQDTKGLTFGAVFGLLIISGLLIFMLRSFKVGVMSVLPNLLPILMAFGLWGLLVGKVGFGLAMVSGMSIGIIVDDTVHFLTKYLYGRRTLGLSARDSVAYSYETVGSSIVFTTLVLVSAFMLMVQLSEFRVNTDMGKMTSIILCFALLFDLVALPAMLMIFDKAQPEREELNNSSYAPKVDISSSQT
jgi:predicted RND superfamily exporter protein